MRALAAEETRGRSQPGRTVRLFLADGIAHGIIIAELGNWSGTPRSRLPEMLRRPEASRTGVYLLTGPDPDRPEHLLAYVGEADDVAARMRIHLRSETKDFFDRLTLIVSSDETLTKAHVRYLESRLIRLIQEAGSVGLTNDTHPDFHRLPEGDRADMDVFVDQVRLLLPVLGLDLFRPEATSPDLGSAHSSNPVFVLSASGAAARARESDEGFVVLVGSTSRRDTSATFPAGYSALRGTLLSDGRLVDGPTPDLYRFAADVSFSSPSAAASIVCARSASGPLEWKVEGSGQSYRDWRLDRLNA